MHLEGLRIVENKPITSKSLEPKSILRKVFTPDLAVDLGTANTLIYMKGRGLVLNEPTVVAVEDNTNKVVAVGSVAKSIYGKTSKSLRVVRPVRNGLIADFDSSSKMIYHFIRGIVEKSFLIKPRVVVGVPSGIGTLEKEQILEAFLNAGVRSVLFIQEPLAAAIGGNLPLANRDKNILLDIGGGTTEIAELTPSGVRNGYIVKSAGEEMDEAIQAYIRRKIGLEIGIFEAEKLKMSIGSALPYSEEKVCTVYGRDVVTSLPKQATVTSGAIWEALEPIISSIVKSIITSIEKIYPNCMRFDNSIAQTTNPVSIESDKSKEIFITGGSCLLPGMVERLSYQTGLRFTKSKDPLKLVITGVGKIIEDLRSYQTLCYS